MQGLHKLHMALHWSCWSSPVLLWDHLLPTWRHHVFGQTYEQLGHWELPLTVWYREQNKFNKCNTTHSQAHTWNFRQWILLCPLYMILWLYIGSAMGLAVPSMNPQHCSKGAPFYSQLLKMLPSWATQGLNYQVSDDGDHRYQGSIKHIHRQP